MSELLNRKPNRIFSLINGLASVSFLVCAYLLPLTVQTRIIGSLGTPLTPPEQIMNPTHLFWGALPGLLLSYIGVVFMILGTGMIVPTSITIMRVTGPKQHESTELLTSGFWGIVRNPIYTSVLLIHLGSSLFLGAIYCLLLYPLFYGSLRLSAWIELNLNLERQFGKEKVAAYKTQVPHPLFNKPLWVVFIVLAIFLAILAFLGYVPFF